MADVPVAEFEEMARGGVAGVEMREADVDVDRIGRNLHGLDDRDAGLPQRSLRLRRLVDSGQDDRLRILAQRRRDGLFLVARRVVRIEDEDLKSRRHEHVVRRPQIVVENAIGERRNDHRDASGARRCERASELVRDIGKLADRSVDAAA